jgi:chloramphenicol-sensitive protein RarD
MNTASSSTASPATAEPAVHPAASVPLDDESPVPSNADRATARAGLISGILAYTLWGVLPFYLALLREVPPVTLVAHRVVWSVVFLAILISARAMWPDLLAALRSPRTLRILLATSLLIAANWLIFVYAVAHRQIVDASLGYFIAPLINVLLGVVFLRERLRAGQTVAFALAATGVLVQIVGLGVFPGIALGLALSFGFYGLLRKVAPVGPLVGLSVETALLSPLALVVILLPAWFGLDTSHVPTWKLGLLSAAGVITAVPLLLFANAARKLRMTTIGFLQYIAPSVQFLIAVTAMGEQLQPVKVASFAFIWVGLAVYSRDSYAHATRTR